MQLTHGLIMKIPKVGEQWRLATSMEHLAAHGWHVFDHTLPGDYSVTKRKEIFDVLAPHPRKKLNGNSMHLRTQGAWMMYCLSYVKVAHDWGELYEEDSETPTLVAVGPKANREFDDTPIESE